MIVTSFFNVKEAYGRRIQKRESKNSGEITCPRSEESGTAAMRENLFCQFSGHMNLVTAESFGNLV
ncbi:hypothetical protein EDC53_11439 [Phytobacter diazotrophicus]|nr:hypothetical protein EDC53_11439 [Phytobacter diazotrophicus]